MQYVNFNRVRKLFCICNTKTSKILRFLGSLWEESYQKTKQDGAESWTKRNSYMPTNSTRPHFLLKDTGNGLKSPPIMLMPWLHLLIIISQPLSTTATTGDQSTQFPKTTKDIIGTFTNNSQGPAYLTLTAQ